MSDAQLNLSAEGGVSAGSDSSRAGLPQLDYGRDQQPRRLRKKHLVIGALLAGCIAGSWLVGRSARDRTQDLLYLRQAASHVDSANTIVFESNPEIAQALVAAGTHVSLSDTSPAPAVLLEPECLRVLRNATGGNRLETVGALIFLHELVTPSGARRIVAIQFLPYYLDGRELPGTGLVAHIFEPGGLLSGPTQVAESHARLLLPVEEEPLNLPVVDDPSLMALHSSSRSACLDTNSPVLRQTFDPWGGQMETLRWYAGQPDELDSTHFTIDYEISGKRGTIDGYLSDDGRQVRMQARPQQPASAVRGGITRISTESGALR